MKHNFLSIKHSENAHFKNYTQKCAVGSAMVLPHWYLKLKRWKCTLEASKHTHHFARQTWLYQSYQLLTSQFN